MKSPRSLEFGIATFSDDISLQESGWIEFYCEATGKNLNVHMKSTY